MKQIFSALFAVFISVNLNADENLHNTHKESDIKGSRFEKWVIESSDKLQHKDYTILTTAGPVQYNRKGSFHKPVILVLHGGFGGWDQGRLIGEHFLNVGFSILCVSRPGYLRTPLPSLPPFVAFTPAEQADVIVALLDALFIHKVAVIGFSAGGPVAYELAQNYPDRVSALVLESIGVNPNEDILFSPVLGEGLSVPIIPDYISYLMHLSTRFDFNSTARELLTLDTSLTGEDLKDRLHSVIRHHDQYEFLKKFINASIPISPRLPGILNDLLGVNYWTTLFNPTGFGTPTMIVQALDDSNGFFPTAQAVHQQLPTSELIPVEKSGHFIWCGPTTKAWQRKVTEFLRVYHP